MHAMSVENIPNQQPPETPIDVLRLEIDFYDRAIIAYLKRRQQASNTIGELRKNAGGPRINVTRENQIYESYSELGPIGRKLASLVLEMGRGPDLTIHEVLDDFKQGKVTLDSAIHTLESRAWPTGEHIPDAIERSHDIIGPAPDPNSTLWVELLLEEGRITIEQYDRIIQAIAYGAHHTDDSNPLQPPQESD